MIYLLMAIAIMVGFSMGKDALADPKLEGRQKALIIFIILFVIFILSLFA